MPWSMSEIPADILQHVFSFLPTKPRLLLVALVCKRWRAAAFRCAASIDLHHHTLAFALRMVHWHQDRRLPICSLTLPPWPHTHTCLTRKFAAVRGLTYLDLPEIAPCCPAGLLLATNSATLVHLKFEPQILYANNYTTAFPTFGTVSLPHLRTLDITCYLNPYPGVEIFPTFLRNHASQLTTLTAHHTGGSHLFSVHRLAQLSFPRLKWLSLVHDESGPERQDMRALLEQMPALELVSIHSIRAFDEDPEMLAMVRTCLWELSDANLGYQEGISELATCTKLRRLMMSPGDGVSEVVLCAPLMARLELLSRVMVTSASIVPPIRSESLRTLIVEWEPRDSAAHVPVIAHLPNLTDLSILSKVSDHQRLMDAVSNALKQCPNIRTLRISASGPFKCSEQTAKAWLAFMHQLDAQGLEMLVFDSKFCEQHPGESFNWLTLYPYHIHEQIM